jgi:hypothetical protein
LLAPPWLDCTSMWISNQHGNGICERTLDAVKRINAARIQW